MTPIPNMGEYYYHNGKYQIKSKLSKKIRVGIACLLLIGSLSVTQARYSTQNIVSSFTTPVSAFVSLITKTNKDVSKKEAVAIVEAAETHGEAFGLDPKLLLAVAYVESTFNKHSISNAGAVGLYQVMIKVHVDKIIEAKSKLDTPEVFDINTNTYLGARILKDCLNQQKDLRKSLLCYNGSLQSPNGYDVKVLKAYDQFKAQEKLINV